MARLVYNGLALNFSGYVISSPPSTPSSSTDSWKGL